MALAHDSPMGESRPTPDVSCARPRRLDTLTTDAWEGYAGYSAV